MISKKLADEITYWTVGHLEILQSEPEIQTKAQVIAYFMAMIDYLYAYNGLEIGGKSNDI